MEPESRALPRSVVVGGKEVPVDSKLLAAVKRYVETQMTLEELASEVGLDSWEEAYELVKKLPAWLLWLPLAERESE